MRDWRRNHLGVSNNDKATWAWVATGWVILLQASTKQSWMQLFNSLNEQGCMKRTSAQSSNFNKHKTIVATVGQLDECCCESCHGNCGGC